MLFNINSKFLSKRNFEKKFEIKRISSDFFSLRLPQYHLA